MKKKILIVDDEPGIVRLLSMRLEAHGYETFGANDSYQGLKIAKDIKPDLIILDLQMPAGGGVHLFENLKASIYLETIPIIFMTGFVDKEVKQLVMKMGADGFFTKPFNSVELLQKIKELIGV